MQKPIHVWGSFNHVKFPCSFLSLASCLIVTPFLGGIAMFDYCWDPPVALKFCLL